MSGNCEDGWDVKYQEDLDAIVEEATKCRLTDINLKDANGSITFPAAFSDIGYINGTLCKDFFKLDLTKVLRITGLDLEPTKEPMGDTRGKWLILPAYDDYQTTFTGSLSVRDIDGSPPLDMVIDQGITLERMFLDNIGTVNDFTGVSYLDILSVKNSELGAAGVGQIELLEVFDMDDRILSLYMADWIRNAHFTNIKTGSVHLGTPMIDSDFFVLESEDLQQVDYKFFQGPTSIGRDLLIRDNARLGGSFDELTYAKNITIENTSNSSFAFPALEEAVSITMRNNPATKIPGNMDNLEYVDDIYLNGEIMTDLGPNIFPGLRRAKNSVVVEPWNADFDCRTLVAQWEFGNINTLRCNGTNGNTNDTSVPSKLGREAANGPAPPRLPDSRRDIPTLFPRGEHLDQVHDFHGLEEGQSESSPQGPCAHALSHANSIIAVALLLALVVFLFARFRQRQKRQSVVVLSAEEQGLGTDEEKPMMAQRS